ncbi:MAG: aminoacetone oxidase family FAD-binding enzyme [Eubacteriales bacterium]
MINNVLIIGGGASGMVAAISAARSGANVTLIEQQSVLGKKILATGNGRCNFSNMELSAEHYYCEDHVFLNSILSDYPTQAILNFFESIGISSKSRNGYLYPFTEQATSIRDALVSELDYLGVTIHLNTVALEITHKNESVSNHGEKDWDYKVTVMKFEEESSKQFTLYSDVLILSTGGKSGLTKQNQTDGFSLIKHLNHHITSLSPALVPLIGQGKFFKNLAGIRAEASVTAYINDTAVRTESGELQLTDYGLSGIPIFQISRILTHEMKKNKKHDASSYSVSIDFMPSYTPEEFLNILLDRRVLLVNRSMKQYLNTVFKDKLASFLLDVAHIDEKKLTNNVTEQEIEKLVRISKTFSVTIKDCKDFKQSQVTAGGIPIQEITYELQSKFHSKLYFTGELLDIDGICGGYNLHFAWASGLLAGTQAAKIK